MARGCSTASCKDSRILSLPADDGDKDDVDQCKTVRSRQPELEELRRRQKEKVNLIMFVYITQKESQNFLQSSKLSDDQNSC